MITTIDGLLITWLAALAFIALAGIYLIYRD
jgi:hypothetical protein